MTLRELIGEGAPEVDISGLAYSSGSVSPGTLFFCVRGLRSDGHDFARDAVSRGAAALVCERPLDLGVPELRVDDARAAMAPLAAHFYGDPTAQLRVAGVTGTNGKTTTAHLIRAILEHAGIATGLLGTVTQVAGGKHDHAERTTPEAADLQKLFRQMVDLGDGACAMEVSSHALALHRVDAIHWAVRVFTNLTQDHLDFHATMEDYYAAKRRLFEGPGPSVVNVDDPYGERLAREFPDSVTYATERDASLRAREIEFDAAGSRFICETAGASIEVVIRLPGRFNVSNALAAIAAAEALGVAREIARDALASAPRVPGRFEPVDEGQGFAVFVDYAHTPDSIAGVLQAARGVARGNLHVVFGAGGDRDRGKRALMGEAAAAHADSVLVTSDNPRSEDPEAIIDEVLAGAGPGADREVDRGKAIARVIGAARDGDVVVIAGKGHEQGQEFANGRKEPFDDVEIARGALRAMRARA